MNPIIRLACLITILAGATLAASVAHAAGTVPCEDALKQLRDQMATSKLAGPNLTAVETLRDKGIERCNADDDKRADGFFTQAMDLLKK
jgi:hypothetical protein